MFSPWARWTLGIVSFVLGLVLLLGASDQGQLWKFLLPLVFLAISGANLLPPRIARWFARAVAVAIALFCLYLVPKVLAAPRLDVRMLVACAVFGGGALLYLFARILPFQFGEAKSGS